jgi:hypothetical protein
MAIDLQSLLSSAQAQVRLASPKAAAKARIAQRSIAEQRADEHARELEKRAVLGRALSANDLDAMRFRWLADHSDCAARLAGQDLCEMRRSIDLWIRQEAIRRLAEMRRDYKDLTGKEAICL